MAGADASLVASTTASNDSARQVIRRPDAVKAEPASEGQRALRPADDVDLDAVGGGEHGREQADRAGSKDEEPVARSEAGGVGGTERIPAGLDHGPGHVVDGIGEG